MSSDGPGPTAAHWAPLTFLLGVLFGTASAITAKVLMGLQAPGADGDLGYFEKPLLVTWIMFLAMALAMPIYWCQQTWHLWQSRRGGGGLLDADLGHPHAKERHTTWRQMIALLVPTVLDLAATALSTAGLVYTTVSVYQLIRCSVLIVTALLKAAVLGQRLTKYMWYGVGINTIAMILIASISFVPGHMEAQPGVHRDPRIGIALILLGCVVQGTQYVWEEKLMTDKIPPLVIVGMEGVWGAILMPLIVFPWAAVLPGSDFGGCIENVRDSWIMIENSTAIQSMLVLFFGFVLLFNIFSIYVTFLLNSVWHAILENFRPGATWIVALALFGFTRGEFGEAWTAWSWLELAGMMIMIAGTAVYNGTIRLPGCEYEAAPGAAAAEKKTTLTMNKYISESSNSLTASPLIQRNVDRERRHSLGPILTLHPSAADSDEADEDTTDDAPSASPSDSLSDYAVKTSFAPTTTGTGASNGGPHRDEATALLIQSAARRDPYGSNGASTFHGSFDSNDAAGGGARLSKSGAVMHQVEKLQRQQAESRERETATLPFKGSGKMRTAEEYHKANNDQPTTTTPTTAIDILKKGNNGNSAAAGAGSNGKKNGRGGKGSK